ncbi:MAG: M56 family metallopeptidase, partial [Bacteroidota bacterium]
WHSLDLLFFELMRIAQWFNPLVYAYQARMAALHEFIADAEVAKNDRPAQYQVLLSEVFKTQNLSFINQFFRESLIKKRIVMLTKKKSKNILQLKYLLLLPVIFGMLFYSSCERETNEDNTIIDSIEVGNIENLTEEEEVKAFNRLIDLSVQSKNWSYVIRDKNSTITFKQGREGSFISGPGGAPIRATMHIESGILDNDFDIFKFDPSKPIRISTNGGSEVLVGGGVPFAVVDNVPIFPGCEDAVDVKACFMEQIQTHIRKHFNYPQEAQDLGLEGRVAVMFTIDENGEIVNIQKRGPHKLLGDEVVRIIKRLPRMEPGKHNGDVVKVPFSIPVNFVLRE